MQSTKHIDEDDTEGTSIRKTVEINNLAFAGIEMVVTPDEIYIDQTGH